MKFLKHLLKSVGNLEKQIPLKYTTATAMMVGLQATALATIPYSPVAGPFPGFGGGVITPDLVGGKEYTHDADHEVLAAGPPNVVPDPQQIVAWDGTAGAGGVTNVTDYTGTRPSYTPDDDIDAIAHTRDFGYRELKEDKAHLVFSVDDFYTLYSFGAPGPAAVSSAGPVTLANGNVIGGAGEYSVEESIFYGNTPDTQSLWASQLTVNGMPAPAGPDDLDGVELWGPEPPLADGDKYSLDLDILSSGAGPATSVWNASGTTYVPHSAIVTGVTMLLGPMPATAFLPVHDLDGEAAINVDALMVQDVIGEPETFTRDPAGGPGDEIIFSIRQIIDPLDPDGYYATGSELFVLNADGTVAYLTHGGHAWDHTYALATFEQFLQDQNNYGVIDINAIEAIGEFAVPEPSGMLLVMLGGAFCLMIRGRRV